MKTKENHGIQHIHIEDLQGNIIIDKRQVDNTETMGELYYKVVQLT
jgi:hypothetical protein